MRIRAQAGHFGILFCGSILCLSTAMAASQTNSPPNGADPLSAEKSWKSPELLQQLQEQQQQLLKAVEFIRQETQGQLQRYTSAVDRIRKDTDASLKRFATTVDGNLDRLHRAVAAERERDLQTMRDSNRFALTTASILIGLLLIEILFIAWFSVRAVNRLTARMSTWITEQSSFAGGSALLGMDAAHPLTGKLVHETSLRLEHAIERVEQRLLDLEHATSRFQTTLATSAAGQGSISSMPQLRSQPPAARAGMASGVSLTVGQGESLIFLPHEKTITPLHTYRNFLQRLRKRFHAERDLKGD